MDAPGPRSLLGIKNLILLKKKNHLNFFKDLHDCYGDVVRFRFGPILGHLVARPEYIKHILVVHRDKYIKGKAYKRLKAFLGTGIITSEGGAWKHQRKRAQPFFTPSAIASFDQAMVDAAQETARNWKVFAKESTPISVVDEMITITAKAITRTMFGADIDESSEVCRCFADALGYVSRKTSSILSVPRFVPTQDNLHFKRCLKVIHSFIDEIISDRKAHLGSDLLSMLLTQEDPLSNQEIRDQLITIFFAGHETTSLLLSWTWYLLSKHPEVESKVCQELSQVLEGRPPTNEDIPHLVYTRMVIDEVLRLYPSVWGFAREAAEEDIIGGYTIPKGSVIMLSPWVSHRHPDFWDAPETFNPERFHPDQKQHLDKFAYIPFSTGPRQCIGNHMALQEGVLVLATLLQQFQLSLCNHGEVKPNPVGTTHPMSPILMNIHKR